MNIDLSNRLYKIAQRVYFGTTELTVHNQRGRLFVKHKGKQIHINNIPLLPAPGPDPVYNYIFNNGFVNHPCPAMQYWIMRHRMKIKITTAVFKQKFLNNTKP